MKALDTTEQALVARAAAAPLIDQTLAWAAINTGTGNLAGLRLQAEALAQAFSVLPGRVELAPPSPVTRITPDGREVEQAHGHHLWLGVRPDAPRRLLLTGHMDTVYPADHPFQACREIEPGIVNGPGVADMKGGLAIMLAALSAWEGEGDADSLGYDVLINSDEENGSASSAALITKLARGKVAALTYEPAALPDGTLAGARPGSGNFSLVVSGRAAHAGRNPQDGRNAIVAASALVLALAGLVRPGLSVNPARIDGGGPNNVVPDQAVVRVNLRPLTPEDQIDAERHLAAMVAKVAQDHDVAIHVHGGFGRPPKPETDGTRALFALVQRAGHDLGQTIDWRPTGGVCDGNNIAACGVPVLDTLGARGGAIHSPEEYVILESLAERARLSALSIARIARGRPA